MFTATEVHICKPPVISRETPAILTNSAVGSRKYESPIVGDKISRFFWGSLVHFSPFEKIVQNIEN